MAAVCLPACDADHNFTVLGYSTRPLYNPHIHTVYVPIFKNLTFYRGLEFELTRELVAQIELKTPFKVVSDCCEADTELTGTIVSYNKNVINRSQINEIREAETTLAVEVIWRDRRTGEVLSRPRAPGTLAPSLPLMPAPNELPGAIGGPGVLGGQGVVGGPGMAIGPGVPLGPVPDGGPPPPLAKTPPTLVQSVATFIPELGGSITTARADNVRRLAIQIVSMMEQPW
jgi:hypothetical protein